MKIGKYTAIGASAIVVEENAKSIARHSPDPRTQLAVECLLCQVPSLSLSMRLHICHTSRKMNHLYLITLFSHVECNTT